MRLSADGTADDLIQPFVLEASGFHGRLVRLGPAVDNIIALLERGRPHHVVVEGQA